MCLTRLLKKLKHYGISNNIYNWIEIRVWLTRRSQCVVLSSHPVPVQSAAGIRQGTILGPLMFLLYLNDISTRREVNKMLNTAGLIVS